MGKTVMAMATMNYNVVKTTEGSMTIYRVVGAEQADNAAICQALTEAAKDVWQYLTAMPGAYTAAELLGRDAGGVILRDGLKLPEELHTLRVGCGKFNLCVKPIDDDGRPNYDAIFSVLHEFEKLARVKQSDRAVFTVGKELGALVCEACVVLPANMKAICDCCGDDDLRPSVNYPALDLDRRCIVATDCVLLVAKKVTVSSIHYEDRVPETFYLPKEVARMQGEVTVRLYEQGCTVTDLKGTEVSVEHEAPYPKWHTVWSPLRGGMTLVDSKAWTKVVKSAIIGLPQKGKWKDESLLLTHYPASDNLTLRGYDGAEMVNEQRITDCVATDEVPYRIGVNPARLLKVLALQPKTMWMGYSEYDTLPARLVMEDAEAEMVVELIRYDVDDLRDALMPTEKEYVVSDTRRLYHCFDKDGWLLEQVETKYPTCGEKPEPRKQTKEVLTRPKVKSTPRKGKKMGVLRTQRNQRTPIIQTTPTTHTATPLSLADRLREALRARLAA